MQLDELIQRLDGPAGKDTSFLAELEVWLLRRPHEDAHSGLLRSFLRLYLQVMFSWPWHVQEHVGNDSLSKEQFLRVLDGLACPIRDINTKVRRHMIVCVYRPADV